MKESIEYYNHTIEKAIKAVGVDPIITRKEPGHWCLRGNNIPIWIYLINPSPQQFYLQIASKVLDLPSEQTGKLCDQLLYLNGELIGAAFFEKEGKVYISTSRDARGLDISEAIAMIIRIGNYVNYYKKAMQKGLFNWTPYRS